MDTAAAEAMAFSIKAFVDGAVVEKDETRVVLVDDDDIQRMHWVNTGRIIIVLNGRERFRPTGNTDDNE